MDIHFFYRASAVQIYFFTFLALTENWMNFTDTDRARYLLAAWMRWHFAEVS